jgi:acetyltransferase
VQAELESDASLSPAKLTSPPAGYPADLEQQVALPTGETITLRPIVPDDAPRMRRAFEMVDSQTVRNRFFTGAPPSDPASIDYLVTVNYTTRLALVAMDSSGASVAIGRYEATEDPASAEVAIVVAPAWRRKGVGGVVLAALEAPARKNGYERLIALYLPDNAAVDTLLKSLGYGDRTYTDGISTLEKALH